MSNEGTVKLPFNKTYIEDKNGNRYYFDVNTDTSKSASSEVADAPIDARKGATLQDKRVINMKTVGISGKFSSRANNGLSFRVASNRLGIIINYFETACDRQEIYTVCKKGAMYYNMMLNEVEVSFGDYVSTVEISLSFIETNIINLEDKGTFKKITSADFYTFARENSFLVMSVANGTYALKAYPPKLSGSYESNYLNLYIGNPNGDKYIMEAQVSVVYRQNRETQYYNFVKKVKGKSGVSVKELLGSGASNIEVMCYFKPLDVETEDYSVNVRDSDSTRIVLGGVEEEESSSS